jgi:D-alanyl-D-alanine carboxypeptidase/D-alanyl-D-alanine-endopeptidase (penicillin-binding protein 4)
LLPPGAEATVEVPVADPIRHFWAAAEALSAAGVDVAGSVRIADGPVGTDQQLAAVESASVAGLVRSMNVNSNNVVADSLARSVATTVTGEGSWAAWEAVVDDRLSSLGVGTASIRDGSGLSRYSLVPARDVVALLEWVADRPRTDVFYGSLPRPGEGTLADRLDGVTVAAKTGTLTGVRTLSGRVGDGGEAIRFAALVGGLAVDEESVCDRQDDLVQGLAASGAPVE